MNNKILERYLSKERNGNGYIKRTGTGTGKDTINRTGTGTDSAKKRNFGQH